MKQILILALLISYSHHSFSQCIIGDCMEGNGTSIISFNQKYIGDFKDGKYHGIGKLYEIKYDEVQAGLFSKNETIVFEGIFKNGNQKEGRLYKEGKIQFDGILEDGNYKKGKSYIDEELVYDGEYLLKGQYLSREGKGKSYQDGKLIFEGIFENNNWKIGKAYKNETLVYDGEFSSINGFIMRHGNGILYQDENTYYLRFYQDEYEYYVNKYSIDDIKGNFEKTEIELKTRDGGLNELIDIEINGIQFSYTYDTGAEVFDISPGLEKILIENGLIDEKDYYPPINSVDANGNITLTRRVKISGIKIGDYIVDNVVVTINQKDDDPLLFGRTILNKKFNNNVIWRPGLLTLYK